VLHEGLIGVIGEEGLQEIDYSDVEETPIMAQPKPLPAGWGSPTSTGPQRCAAAGRGL
jgi:hypothetical protein